MGVIHDQNMKRKLILIKEESDIFGLLFIGDGATITRIILFSILVSVKNFPLHVFENVDFQGNLAYGGKIWNHYMY